MSVKKWPDKDPDDVLDYELDWTDRLGTDTIDTSTWFVPAGLTSEEEDKAAKTTTLWLSGGMAGTSYDILNRVTTIGGRQYDQTVRLKVKEH